MNVGLYYHAGTIVDGDVALPSHLAVFVEELARQVGAITYFGHTDPRSEIEDHLVSPPLVRPIGIGRRRSFPARTLWPRPALRHFVRHSRDLDVMLIRGPTPLLPHIARVASCPVALLLVGEYHRPHLGPRWRRLAISGWVRLYEHQQARAAKHAVVMTNSGALTRSAEAAGYRAREVFTSSLTEADLAGEQRSESEPGASGPIRLLFAGRITEEKGILEAVEALSILSSRGRDVLLELAGWFDAEGFRDLVERLAERQEVADRIVFSGYLRAGAELTEAYRRADVFIMPSHAEGFPRAIVEALAAGCPVVASRVGGVPERLSEHVAILVEPRDPHALANAVERIATDRDLRRSLVREGRAWASGFTNERSCALVVEALREVVDLERGGASSGGRG